MDELESLDGKKKYIFCLKFEFQILISHWREENAFTVWWVSWKVSIYMASFDWVRRVGCKHPPTEIWMLLDIYTYIHIFI